MVLFVVSGAGVRAAYSPICSTFSALVYEAGGCTVFVQPGTTGTDGDDTITTGANFPTVDGGAS
ncbi:hypothetical protein [Streptomyces gilvosporeus]|uniref:hypothetical protein n=1 Tax=Streptomyces gilvosporeus TaxID=553510 RepID=UPI00131E04C8|nr:hypothetical protein [Streptomyces gilvosporeus]